MVRIRTMPLKPSKQFGGFFYVKPTQNCHFDEGENSTTLTTKSKLFITHL